jgi:hypothetical protein
MPLIIFDRLILLMSFRLLVFEDAIRFSPRLRLAPTRDAAPLAAAATRCRACQRAAPMMLLLMFERYAFVCHAAAIYLPATLAF